jgi:hypothetical protein
MFHSCHYFSRAQLGSLVCSLSTFGRSGDTVSGRVAPERMNRFQVVPIAEPVATSCTLVVRMHSVQYCDAYV